MTAHVPSRVRRTGSSAMSYQSTMSTPVQMKTISSEVSITAFCTRRRRLRGSIICTIGSNPSPKIFFAQPPRMFLYRKVSRLLSEIVNEISKRPRRTVVAIRYSTWLTVAMMKRPSTFFIPIAIDTVIELVSGWLLRCARAMKRQNVTISSNTDALTITCGGGDEGG